MTRSSALSPRAPWSLSFVALAALAVSFSMLAGPALAQQVGVSAAVRGGVQVNASAARSGQSMFLGDRVLTQTQSGMQVLLLDESVFTIGENNDLTITRFVYDPDRSAGEIAASAAQGVFRFVSGGVGAIAPDNIEITTPSATIGVRGTAVDGVIGAQAVALAARLGLSEGLACLDPIRALFVILRGPSNRYQGITQRGRVVVSTPAGRVALRREGYGVFVPCPGAAPTASFPVPGDVDSEVIASIEVPAVGVTDSLPTVDINELPGVEALPGGVPDLAGPPLDPDETFEIEVRVDELIEELFRDYEDDPIQEPDEDPDTNLTIFDPIDPNREV